MGFTGNNKSPNRSRPTHFPITPFLDPPPLPPLPQHLLKNNHSLRLTRMEHDSARRGLASPIQQAPEASIYDAFARSNHPYAERVSDRGPVIDIPASSKSRQAVPPLLSPNAVTGDRFPSRSSSIDNFSNAPSIYSPSSTMTDLNDVHESHARLNMMSPSDGGYESSSTIGRGGRRNRSNVRAHMETAEVLEEHADEDKISARISISSKRKADKVLGLAAPTTGLVSAYICSGLGLVSFISTNDSKRLTERYPSLGPTLTLTPSRASSLLPTLWAPSGDPRSSPMPILAIVLVISFDTVSTNHYRGASLSTSSRWSDHRGCWTSSCSTPGRQNRQSCSPQGW
jgi:hypothetical protein